MMMKKHLIIGALSAMMLAAAPAAQAQGLLNNPDNHAYLGLRASLDISAPSGQDFLGFKDMFGNSAGFSVGAIYNIPVFMNLYVEPGLSLYYNTMAQNPQNVPTEDGLEHLNNGSLRMFGARIPVMVGYRFDLLSSFSLYVFTGPRFSYNFSGRWHQKLEGSRSESEDMYGGDGVFHRFDAQWQFGVGASFGRLYVGFSGNVGMSQMTKKLDIEHLKTEMRKNGFEITLGYNF